jgi:hypothetical protein
VTDRMLLMFRAKPRTNRTDAAKKEVGA